MRPPGRLSVPLALLALAALVAMPFSVQAAPAGTVERVQGRAEAGLPEPDRALKVRDELFENEVLETGADARLLAELRSGLSLTLGGDSRMVLDSLVLDGPRQSAVFRLVQGAFLLTSGDLGAGSLSVITPVGTIGIRGTEFWGGPMRGAFGVFVLSGTVEFTN